MAAVKRQRQCPIPDREISPYTFSRIIDREMIARIREVEAATAARERAGKAQREGEVRFQQAARRFRDYYQTINGLDEGVEIVFEGKIWHFDTEVDGSLICYSNYAIVLTDVDAPARDADETPSEVVRLETALVASAD